MSIAYKGRIKLPKMITCWSYWNIPCYLFLQCSDGEIKEGSKMQSEKLQSLNEAKNTRVCL